MLESAVVTRRDGTPEPIDPAPVELILQLTEAQAGKLDGVRGRKTRVSYATAALIAAIAAAGAAEQERMARPSDACPHPKARVHKGLCGACGTNVTSMPTKGTT